MTNLGERPEMPQPRPAALITQSPERGRRLDSLGWGALLAGGVCYMLSGNGPDWLQWILRLSSLGLIAYGLWAVLRGQRHLAPVLPGIRQLPSDERIVLFLRAFTDDRGLARSGFRFRRLPFGWMTVAHARTEEQQAARGLAPFGRMVALGQPSDRLPYSGAERSYTSDAEWQSEVLAGLDRANLVLLAAGPGDGLEWEVAQVASRNDPARLIIVVTRDGDQYAQFRAAVGHLFPKGLPEPSGMRRRYIRDRYVRAVIWFDHDWTAHLEVLRGGATTRTQRALQRALQPVYQRAGVSAPSKRPTRPHPKLVTAAVTTFLGFWISAEIVFWILPMTILNASGKPGESSGLLAITGDPTLDTAFVTTLLTVLWLVPAGIWMRNASRGGPVAIFMLQMMSIFTGLLSLTGLLVLWFMWTVALLIVNPALFPLVLLGFGLVAIGVVGVPLTGLLLQRREVREWMNSRA